MESATADQSSRSKTVSSSGGRWWSIRHRFSKWHRHNLLQQSPTYQPLPTTTCTRLITIDRVDHHAHYKLHLRLSIIDLSLITGPTEYDFLGETPDRITSYKDEFDALSYTWGAPLSTPECMAAYGPASDVDIVISTGEGSTFSHKIGRNLYEALAHLATRSGPTRRLWVDAVCINQQDIIEKEKHILLMSSIYNKAHNVLVWLGQDILNSEDVKHLTWFHGVALERASRHEPWPTHNDFMLSEEQDGIYIVTMDDFLIPGDTLRALFRFYAQRRYFKRAWTVQEVSLAHRCGVILGEHSVHIQSFVLAQLFMQDMGSVANSFAPDNTAHDEGAELGNLIYNMTWFEDLKARRGRIVRKICPFNDLCNDLCNDREYHLALLRFQLSNGMTRKASDPRDIIYCLLGWAQAIVPLEDPPIKPDYTATTQQVFISATIAFLEGLPHCSILGLVVEKPEHAEYVKRLPSWVPDYATCQGGSATYQRYVRDADRSTPPFCTSKGDECNARLSIRGLHLSVSARHVARMKFCVQLSKRVAPTDVSNEQRRINELIGEAALLSAVLEVCLTLVKDNSPGVVEPLLRVLCFGNFDIPNAVDFRLLWRIKITTMDIMLENLHRHGWQTSRLRDRLHELCEQLLPLPIIPDQAFRQAYQVLDLVMPAWKRRMSLTQAQMRGMLQLWMSSWAPLADEFFGSSYVFPSSDGNTANIEGAVCQMDDFIKFIYGRHIQLRIGSEVILFVTEQYNVGRLPSKLQPADELWIICNATLPSVLRPQGNGQYRLIGEAYVHGAMFGELIENGQAGEVQDITIV